VGIYSSSGQTYEPVDVNTLLYYKEAKDGQILEEGITEAGSMGSFIAAGNAYATYGVNTIPFFIYYSMFGFQRIGDQAWAFGDARGKGFLLGGTAGRTTLLGEGLQHQDGHSHVLSSTIPNCRSYDPAFAYEIAVIVQEGIRRMYEQHEDCFYYLTICNENYVQPAMPEGDSVREGILRGLYLYKPAENGSAQLKLFGSGPILNEVLKAQRMLAEQYGVAADVWSVTSYNELRRDALAVERWNRLHPAEPERKPFLLDALGNIDMPIIAASDYMKVVADQIAPWLPGRLTALGTDGFGRSDNREHLRSRCRQHRLRRTLGFSALGTLRRRSRRASDPRSRCRSREDRSRRGLAEKRISYQHFVDNLAVLQILRIEGVAAGRQGVAIISAS
jgi:pyruvate dehydrogenase E1 component